jgi:hypothetical protein
VRAGTPWIRSRLPKSGKSPGVGLSLLAPGGFLYLVEGHPFVQVLSESDTGELSVAYDYFDSAPQVEDYPHTYTDGPPLSVTRSVQFQHSFGSILTALISAGLRLEFVHEHDFDTFQRFTSMSPGTDRLYRIPAGRTRVPMLFSLRALRPD